MRTIILDTNFILTAVKNKLYFLDELAGDKIIIPDEVIYELKSFENSKKKKHFKLDAELALRILENKKYEKIKLGNKYVDKGIFSYAKKNPHVYIATLDKEIKSKFKGRIFTIVNRKKLEIV
ncbi:MAG: PIN domain-containing protein [Nanoarchaeota archaeon]|nr:PIN domain-containing protein [Nanoarchaeota archaeon]